MIYSLQADYPDLISIKTIGNSWQDRPIELLTLDAFAHLNSGSNKYDRPDDTLSSSSSLVQLGDDDYEGMVGVLLGSSPQSESAPVTSPDVVRQMAWTDAVDEPKNSAQDDSAKPAETGAANQDIINEIVDEHMKEESQLTPAMTAIM